MTNHPPSIASAEERAHPKDAEDPKGWDDRLWEAGRLFMSGRAQERAEGFVMIRDLARKGHLEAQYELGRILEWNTNLDQNSIWSAARWYALAARREHPLAVERLRLGMRVPPRDGDRDHLDPASAAGASIRFQAGTVLMATNEVRFRARFTGKLKIRLPGNAEPCVLSEGTPIGKVEGSLREYHLEPRKRLEDEWEVGSYVLIFQDQKLIAVDMPWLALEER